MQQQGSASGGNIEVCFTHRRQFSAKGLRPRASGNFKALNIASDAAFRAKSI